MEEPPVVKVTPTSAPAPMAMVIDTTQLEPAPTEVEQQKQMTEGGGVVEHLDAATPSMEVDMDMDMEMDMEAVDSTEFLDAATPSMDPSIEAKVALLGEETEENEKEKEKEGSDGDGDVDVDIDIDADDDDEEDDASVESVKKEGDDAEVTAVPTTNADANDRVNSGDDDANGGEKETNEDAEKEKGSTSTDESERADSPSPEDGSNAKTSEEEAPASIAAVPDSNESPKTSEHEDDDEALIAKVEASVKCHRVEVLPTGEILVLPKGWSTRQSKTHGGHTYYVSPYGQTQWLRPPIKTGLGYKWNHEIEVTFGPGRLGLNLKQVIAEPGQPFTDLPVYIAEIYKLVGGPSPAEIYNWGVKPEKRLCVGMRMTAMNGAPLTGFTYTEVLDKIARMLRPLRIKFADVSKGIVGRVEEEKPPEETEEQKEARNALAVQKNLRAECFQVAVARELHCEVWNISRNRMNKKEQEVNTKIEILTQHLEAMNEMNTLLEKESESLINEAQTLREQIEKLQQQEEGKIESPEVIKSVELQTRNASLDEEIKAIIAENEVVLRERTQAEEVLDAVSKELEAYGDEDEFHGLDDFDAFSNAFLGSLVDRGSINQLADDAHDRLLEKIRLQQAQFQQEIAKQHQRVKVAEADVEQFKQQMALADATFQREYSIISGDRPALISMLQEKIVDLRSTLHETVGAVMRAATSGDRIHLNEMTIKRGRLTEELAKTINELENLQVDNAARGSNLSYRESDIVRFGSIDEGGRESFIVDKPSPSAATDHDSEVAQLRKRLNSLQHDLLDTVNELASSGTSSDVKHVQELNERRTRLKEDIDDVQQQYHALTRTSSTRPPRPPVSPSARASQTGRVAMDLGMASKVDRPSSSVSSDRPSADRVSLAPSTGSVGASTIIDTTEGQGMPTIAGPLMKHPTHSNEKGLFRNMSLRGIRERYCVLDGTGTLKVFKRKTDREPRSVIPLDLVSLEVVYSKTEVKSTQFTLCTTTYQNRFDAKNHKEMMRWAAALEKTHEILMQQRAALAGGAHKSNGHGSNALSASGQGSEDSHSHDSNGRSVPPSPDTSAPLSDSQARGAKAMKHRATLGF